MKKMIIGVIMGLSAVLVAGTSHASTISLDVGGSYASEPVGNFGSTVGPGAGVDIGWNVFAKERVKGKARGFLKNIKFRIDMHYYKWDDSIAGLDIEYTRIPLFLGGRYYFPVSGMNKAGWEVFGEGGLEVSRDEWEEVIVIQPATLRRVSDSKTHTGAAVGGGIRYNFTDTVFGGVSGRFHAIDDSYMTIDLAIGFYLN